MAGHLLALDYQFLFQPCLLVTAVSGSGPAYFFLLAEQMAAAGVALGLDPDAAQLLAAETLYGAGQLAHADPALDRQRSAVTSRGGTTEAAVVSMYDIVVWSSVRVGGNRYRPALAPVGQATRPPAHVGPGGAWQSAGAAIRRKVSLYDRADQRTAPCERSPRPELKLLRSTLPHMDGR